MVFNTNNIRKNFKYKSKPSYSTSSNTSSKPYQGPPKPTTTNITITNSGLKERTFNRLQVPSTLEAAVNSNKLVKADSKGYDMSKPLTIDWGGTAAADRGNNNFDVGDFDIQQDTTSNPTPDPTPDPTPQPTPQSTPGLDYNAWYSTPRDEKVHKTWKAYKEAHNLTPGSNSSGGGGGGDIGPFQTVSNLFQWGDNSDKYQSDKGALADSTVSGQSDLGVITYNIDGSVSTVPEGVDKSVTFTAQQALEDKKSKYSDKQYPLYFGAPDKMNIQSDGMVGHTGYEKLDTTNATINNLADKKTESRNYIPGVTPARGISSNVSMDFTSPGIGTKAGSLADSFNFQSTATTHTGMVKEWQTGFLTSSSRDEVSASHWLNSQLGKIDAMEGRTKDKNMFKKDLRKRFDGLFRDSSAPFQSPQTFQNNQQINKGLTKQQQKNEAKRLQALQASEGYFNSSSIQNFTQPFVEPKKDNKKIQPAASTTNVIDEYNDLGSMYRA